MNYYETLYIVHPALETGRLKDIILGVEDSLKKVGGGPLSIDLWGKRKLAYFINKQKYGTYVLVQYNGKEKCTNDFAVELEHNPNILAHLTTNIDQDDVMEQEENLETQIAGKTREFEKIISNLKTNNDKESMTLDSEAQTSDPLEGKGLSVDGDEQTGSNMDDKKNDESNMVLAKEEKKQTGETENEKTASPEEENVTLPIEESDDAQKDFVAKPETIDEDKSPEENPSEEAVSKSNQEKADEPAAINEKE